MQSCNRVATIVAVTPCVVLATISATLHGGGASFQGLGDLPGRGATSRANAVSADGLVVVGKGASASGTEAFRWTLGGGMVGLGDLPGGSFLSEAYGVSADGSVVVGNGSTSVGTRAFRWTSGGGMVGLGFTPGGGFGTAAYAVSADGSVVVGEGFDPGISAVIWDDTNGLRNLQDVLVNDLGLDLTGWLLTGAIGVSADGRTIVGTGNISGFFGQAWIATLGGPPLPEDTNGDGVVNVLDLIDLLLCFGQPASPGCEAQDINGDGTVNVLDLIDLLLAFGATSP